MMHTKLNLPITNCWSFPKQSEGVVYTLHQNGHEAYFVGGCVRDLLIGRTPKDFDITTSATPEQVQKIFPKTIPTGIKHGTVTVIWNNEHIEVTTFRSESNYVDGRRPESVKFETNLTADLARRDFTANAIAYNPSSMELIDPFNGLEDISNWTLRAVGNPTERFNEDGLRCMRAARFASTLRFTIEESTYKAISGALPTFSKVSKERIREELVKLLCGVSPAGGLNVLSSTGMLEAILPDMVIPPTCNGWSFIESDSKNETIRLCLFFSQFLQNKSTEEIANIMKSMTFPNKLIVEIIKVLENLLPFEAYEEWNDERIRRWMASVGPELVDKTIIISEILRKEHGSRFYSRINRIHQSKPPLYAKDLALNGNEIKAIMVNRPPDHIGLAIRFLIEMVIEHPDRNTKEELTRLLKFNFET